MHFNRTQFAANVFVRLFAIAILILAFLLSSCVDDIDLSKIFSAQYHVPGINFEFPLGNSPSFSLDSVRYDSISIYRVCSSIRFDSTIVLTGFTFNYCEENKQVEINRIRQILVDTLDFAVTEAYHYKVRIAKMKGNTSYQICGVANYLVGKDTTFIASPCITFRTE